MGGVGTVASEATRDLFEYGQFDKIIIGDYALDKAQAVAKEIWTPV
jgi:saccharopine dehydrogenase-like NADP-dependent oxidoreductase